MGESILEDAPANSSAAPKPPAHLQIHFVKSSYFRVIHANGVWFGGDNQNNIHLTFFNERTPIPTKVVVNLNNQGLVVGEEASKRDSKDGVIREMEADVVFSIPAAVEFYKTLGDNLKALKAI